VGVADGLGVSEPSGQTTVAVGASRRMVHVHRIRVPRQRGDLDGRCALDVVRNSSLGHDGGDFSISRAPAPITGVHESDGHVPNR
jgi:hypothetical protein